MLIFKMQKKKISQVNFHDRTTKYQIEDIRNFLNLTDTQTPQKTKYF